MENLTETDGPHRSSSGLDPAEEYKMDNKRRGLALIINQEHYDTGFKSRAGTEVDRNSLEKSLKEQGFEVRVYNDSTKKKVETSIKKVSSSAKGDHSDADCFLLAFFSHSENDRVLAKDGEISIQEITTPFRGDECKSLVGKPKIFILHTTEARQKEKDVDCPATPAGVSPSKGKPNESMVDAIHTLPAGADFIMCYSVAEGYASISSKEDGSWYIHDLCKMLGEHGDSLEFTDLLTMVNRKVSMRSVENKGKDRAAIEEKQVPCFASMLTKQLYFHPKK